MRPAVRNNRQPSLFIHIHIKPTIYPSAPNSVSSAATPDSQHDYVELPRPSAEWHLTVTVKKVQGMCRESPGHVNVRVLCLRVVFDTMQFQMARGWRPPPLGLTGLGRHKGSSMDGDLDGGLAPDDY